MEPHNTIDARLAELVSEQTDIEKLKTLLRLDGGSIHGWAQKHGFRSQEVHMTLSGDRPYPAIRDCFAEVTRLPRAEVDRILDSAKTPSLAGSVTGESDLFARRGTS